MAQQLKLPLPIPDTHEIIFRPWRRLKNGTILYAKQCGIKAFPMLVKKKQ